MSTITAPPSCTRPHASQDNFTAKVRELIAPDGEYGAGLAACHEEPAAYAGAPTRLSTREMDLRDWGFLYGAAFATARLQAPDEDEKVSAQRALDTARTLEAQWGTCAPRPSLSPLVDAVLLAFFNAPAYGLRGVEGMADLEEALNDLHAGFGCPAEVTA
jgi:hypothetical protein